MKDRKVLGGFTASGFVGYSKNFMELFHVLSNPTFVLGVGEEAVKEKKTVT